MTAKIDAHVHTWTLEPGSHAWIEPNSSLHRDFPPGEVARFLRTTGMDACVAVQSDSRYGDTDRLLKIAERSAWIDGVVGWLSFHDSKNDLAHLERWCRSERMAGIRVHSEASALGLSHAAPVLAAIARANLAIDVHEVLARGDDLATTIADQVAGIPVVLNHLGKPDADESDEFWLSALTRFARRDNAYVKFSGLQMVRELSQPKIEFWLHAVLELFGVERVMFGSDWPLSHTGRVMRQDRVVARLAGELSRAEQAAFFGGAASAAYRHATA